MDVPYALGTISGEGCFIGPSLIPFNFSDSMTLLCHFLLVSILGIMQPKEDHAHARRVSRLVGGHLQGEQVELEQVRVIEVPAAPQRP